MKKMAMGKILGWLTLGLLLGIVSLCAPRATAAGGMMGGGGCGGGGCGGGGMGGGGSTSVIDPPIGSLLKDPVELPADRSTPGVAKFDIETRIAPINVNGTTANLMTYNGCIPGPTIRIRKGEQVAINLTNSLPATNATNLLGHLKNRSNLHTHGWHVSPEPPADYVMYSLNPGETYHHLYDTTLQNAGTLNFYHPHGHGAVAEQVWAGLVGALVVEDDVTALKNYETHILILKDIALSGSEPAPHSTMHDYMMGKEGNTVMVNGQVNPRLYLKNGQVQRWRILNGSNARFYKIALDGHNMNLVGTDDGLLDKPYAQPYLILSPGERVDVLVKGTASSGNFKLKALPYSRMGMMSSPTITLMTVTYNGKLTTAQNLPATINPNAKRLNIDTSMLTKRTMTLSMSMNAGYINGQTFDSGNPYSIMSQVGTYEVWTVVNASNMDHPFHQHVNGAQVLSISGGDAGYASLYTSIPAWKDVVLIPKGGSATLLVPVMDYTGMAMFHCHILEHEDIGMLGVWDIMDMGGPMDPM